MNEIVPTPDVLSSETTTKVAIIWNRVELRSPQSHSVPEMGPPFEFQLPAGVQTPTAEDFSHQPQTNKPGSATRGAAGDLRFHSHPSTSPKRPPRRSRGGLGAFGVVSAAELAPVPGAATDSEVETS